jgi:hypothetical protein
MGFFWPSPRVTGVDLAYEVVKLGHQRNRASMKDSADFLPLSNVLYSGSVLGS